MYRTANFDREDVIDWLGLNEVRKGEAYISQVKQLHIADDVITAQVQGTARVPYQVEVVLDDIGDSSSALIEARCTCPVGYHCKHVAAVMLATIIQNKVPDTDQVGKQVLAWATQTHLNFNQKTKPKKGKAEALAYVLSPFYSKDKQSTNYVIQIRKGVLSEHVWLKQLQPWFNIKRALSHPPAFITDGDRLLLGLLLLPADYHIQDFAIKHFAGDEVLRQALALGRLYDQNGSVLQLGETRTAQLEWREESGSVRPALAVAPDITTFKAHNLWYLDAKNRTIGLVETPYKGEVLQQLLTLPPLNAKELPVVVNVLKEVAPELPIPQQIANIEVIDVPAIPVLELGTMPIGYGFYFNQYGPHDQLFDYALLRFRYDQLKITPDDKREFIIDAHGKAQRLVRQLKQEQQHENDLIAYRMARVPQSLALNSNGMYGLQSEDAWPHFIAEVVPHLREMGWEIHLPSDFRHCIYDVDEWHSQVSENQGGWFDLDLGIIVAGKRLSLAPLLFALFRQDPRWLDTRQLEAIADDEGLRLKGPDGEQIQVPAARIKPLARTMIDLFDSQHEGPLKLSRLDSPRLAELASNAHWQLHGVQQALEIAARLQHSGGVQICMPPQGLQLELRPYQLQGLAWLQFLRAQNLAGILADDMGLGKTAQTLAHLLLEKESGRMDKPTLVVLPTSLIFNWKREANRFAPQLKVLSLHGKTRAAEAVHIPTSDVILTTYPLLWRDEDMLTAHDYHLLILDEAQTIKNASSKAAQVVRMLNARHRLCLSGTPLENHLGELWALFDFMLPGFLGDQKSFTKHWRTPIEKQGDSVRRNLLAKRIKPFVLRRRKEDVAAELPPKTIIVRTVDMQGGQRDLYETVRSTMDKRVREEIARKGFLRSQIVILDALLKLRQVCCDPRLVKISAAKQVKERAKLDLLMEMLPELVNESRRILLFSQFTTMLTLIEAELKKCQISYVKLTGDTQDREAVVSRFESGEVPVFLISLKAGGVGLNLTSADTVIHYDPWWNPAVENQATDRAHRIGQQKNVFVYKLVVAGSIEEKILALQDKKAELAAGILSEDANSIGKFGADDLSALLAPLPEK